MRITSFFTTNCNVHVTCINLQFASAIDTTTLLADIQRVDEGWRQVREDPDAYAAAMTFYRLWLSEWTADLTTGMSTVELLFSDFASLEQSLAAQQMRVLLDVIDDLTHGTCAA